MRDAALAAQEMARVAKLGRRIIFVGAARIGGRSFGNPDFDPIWAAAEELDLAVCIHLVDHPNYTGSQWYRTDNPGFMYITMMNVQDPRIALTSMVYDGGFERFPRLRVGTIESMARCGGQWLQPVNHRYKYLEPTSPWKH